MILSVVPHQSSGIKSSMTNYSFQPLFNVFGFCVDSNIVISKSDSHPSNIPGSHANKKLLLKLITIMCMHLSEFNYQRLILTELRNELLTIYARDQLENLHRIVFRH